MVGLAGPGFFTEAGLTALWQLLDDPWAMNPVRLAHLREEPGMDRAGLGGQRALSSKLLNARCKAIDQN